MQLRELRPEVIQRLRAQHAIEHREPLERRAVRLAEALDVRVVHDLLVGHLEDERLERARPVARVREHLHPDHRLGGRGARGRVRVDREVS